jgi:hypothetical protein
MGTRPGVSVRKAPSELGRWECLSFRRPIREDTCQVRFLHSPAAVTWVLLGLRDESEAFCLREGLLVGVGCRFLAHPGALVLSYLPDVVDASRASGFPVAGTPAGTVVVRAAGLLRGGGTVAAGDAAPLAGELAVFCRPVVTARRWSAGTAACWRAGGCRIPCG